MPPRLDFLGKRLGINFPRRPAVEAFLDRCAQPLQLGFTALLHATAHGNAAMVKLLLDKGANPNTTFDHPLMVKNGPIALTKLTPLMMAPLSTPECTRPRFPARLILRPSRW